MKILFEFNVTENVSKENGNTEQNVRTFAIAKPNSKLKELAEVFHAKIQSSLVADGVLTRQMLQKRLINDGGVLSEKEALETAELYQSFRDVQSEFRTLITITEKDRTEEQKTKIGDLLSVMAEKSALIQSFELSQIALFDKTAEVMARNRLIFWWILNLAYEKNAKGEYKPIFGEGNYETKRDKYDDVSEDNFLSSVISDYFAEYVTLWFIGRAVTKEDFQSVYDSQVEALKPKEEKTEEAPLVKSE